MTIADKYQFFLEFPSAGSKEAFPVNDTIQFQWKRAEGKRYHRRELTTRLSFHNDYGENIIDFDPWYRMERNKQRCEKVKLTINAACDEAFEEHYKAQATVLDGEFDAGLCKVDVKFQPDDPYACIYNNWEKERNILPLTPPVTLNVIQGTYQFSQTCMEEVPAPATDTFRFTQTIVTNCIEQNEGWTLWKQFYSWSSSGNPQNPDDGVWSLQTQWVREFLDTTDDPGGEWLPVSTGGYARAVAVAIDFENVGYGIVHRQYKIIFPGDIGIDNGRYLNDIIQDFWDEYCGYPLVSNFFGINPDGTQPSNTAYTSALEDLQELVVFAKDDIIEHGGDENATLLNMSLKKLIEMLEIMFNVELRFDYTNETFYLEHYSYWTANLMLDLTAAKWLHCIQDKWAWSYNKEQVPPREKFQWEDTTDYGPALDVDFDGLPILYAQDCSSEQTDKIYRADVVTTNITKLIEDGDPENWTITPNSFVIVASSGGYILREAGAISGIVHLNGALAWANLLRDYHKWGRPLNRGIMNGQQTEFTSPKKIRKQVPIEIPMCCSELKEFDPDRIIVKTQLGHGEVETATYDDPRGTLTLELVFD